MKRSSAVVLVGAALLAGACGVLFARSDTESGPMTNEAARQLLQRGCNALARRDVSGIMALMSPTAEILDRSPEQMRAILQDAIQQMGDKHFKPVLRNVTVHPEGATAIAACDIDLDQDAPGATIHYYTAHLSVRLSKTPQTHLLGLYHSDDWKIVDVQSDTDLDVPTP